MPPTGATDSRCTDRRTRFPRALVKSPRDPQPPAYWESRLSWPPRLPLPLIPTPSRRLSLTPSFSCPSTTSAPISTPTPRSVRDTIYERPAQRLHTFHPIQAHGTLPSALDATRTFPGSDVYLATTRLLTALQNSYSYTALRVQNALGPRAILSTTRGHHRSAPSHLSWAYSRRGCDGDYDTASADTFSGDTRRPLNDSRQVTRKKARHSTRDRPSLHLVLLPG